MIYVKVRRDRSQDDLHFARIHPHLLIVTFFRAARKRGASNIFKKDVIFLEKPLTDTTRSLVKNQGLTTHKEHKL